MNNNLQKFALCFFALAVAYNLGAFINKPKTLELTPPQDFNGWMVVDKEKDGTFVLQKDRVFKKAKFPELYSRTFKLGDTVGSIKQSFYLRAKYNLSWEQVIEISDYKRDSIISSLK